MLLHGWEQWGQDLLPRLRGMFAFALWDRKTETLFCARDPFGIKPLYYYVAADGTLLFASEIKAFLDHPAFKKRLNESQLELYLSFQYSPGEDTFFRGVKKLLPAHCLTLDGTGLRGGTVVAGGVHPRALPHRLGRRHRRDDAGQRGRPQDCRRGGGGVSFGRGWIPPTSPPWPGPPAATPSDTPRRAMTKPGRPPIWPGCWASRAGVRRITPEEFWDAIPRRAVPHGRTPGRRGGGGTVFSQRRGGQGCEGLPFRRGRRRIFCRVQHLQGALHRPVVRPSARRAAQGTGGGGGTSCPPGRG